MKSNARTYRDPETGIAVTIPGGFNFTEPMDGALITALAPTAGGVIDNISLKIVPADLSGPAPIDSPAFIAKTTEALCGRGASNITATATTIAGSPAVSLAYEIGTTPVYGVQLHVPGNGHVLVLTVTAGTAERAQSAAAVIDVKAAA